MFDDLKKLTNKAAELKRELQEEGEKAIRAAIKEYFDKHEGVKAIRWVQYTPYFNDGDACIFGMHNIGLKFKKSEVQPTEGDGGYHGEYDDSDEEEFWYPWHYDSKDGPEVKDLLDLQGMLKNMEDILQDVFGDHTRVTITRKGITTEEYDHD